MPHFEHDCSGCTYLGSIIDKNEAPCDLYVCVDHDQIEFSSLIARYSSEGPDYKSCPLLTMKAIQHDHALGMAFTLAEARNLFTPKKENVTNG